MSRSSAFGTTSPNRESESGRPTDLRVGPGGRAVGNGERGHSVPVAEQGSEHGTSLGGVPAATTGRSTPLGATVVDTGVNFSLFSRTAAAVDLLFFDREDDPTPSRVFRIDPAENRTYHYWHVFVPGVRPGQIYGYRVGGPSDPASGGCGSTRRRVLLDPYGSRCRGRPEGLRPRGRAGSNG